MWSWLTDLFSKLWKHLTFSNGKSSKTALWLGATLGLGLPLWVFLSLFGGNTLVGWWDVPLFDSTAFMAVIGTVGGLYFANHNLTAWKVSDMPLALPPVATKKKKITKPKEDEEEENE